MITWDDSRTSQFHVRKALHGRRTEPLSRKIKRLPVVVRAAWTLGFAEGRLESQEHPLPVTLNKLFHLYMPQFPHPLVGIMAFIDWAGMKV